MDAQRRRSHDHRDRPASGSFTGRGADELRSGATAMDIKNVHLVGNLADGCSASLYGIQFNGAGGSLTHSTVANIRYGTGSGCQSGNSIDITNVGGATRLPVTVDDVQVTGFQKTGIRANGNVALRLTELERRLVRPRPDHGEQLTADQPWRPGLRRRQHDRRQRLGRQRRLQRHRRPALRRRRRHLRPQRGQRHGHRLRPVRLRGGGYTAGRTTLSCNLFSRDAAADSTPTPGRRSTSGTPASPRTRPSPRKIDATGNTVEGFATPWENVEDVDGGACASGPVSGLAVNGATSRSPRPGPRPPALDYAPVTGYDVTLLPGGTHQTVTAPPRPSPGSRRPSSTGHRRPAERGRLRAPRAPPRASQVRAQATISPTATTDHSASVAVDGARAPSTPPSA